VHGAPLRKGFHVRTFRIAHTQLIRYYGAAFPKEYQGGAFLVWHGSWNRAQRQGYEVAFVPFDKGKPSGPPRDFVTGWMTSPDSPEVWGRPVSALEMPDGSLLVSEDGANKVWRISYGK
jgi:glucose/arabinose dehydrogenase